MAEPDRYLDEDTTDAYLDLEQPRYQGRTSKQDSAAVDDLLERAKRGEIELPKLPPPVDH
jgi:hypothetical protein